MVVSYLSLPKAELKTKHSTKRQLCCRLVEFLFFNSIGKLISLPSDEVYRVGDGGPDHAVVLHLYIDDLREFIHRCDYSFGVVMINMMGEEREKGPAKRLHSGCITQVVHNLFLGFGCGGRL